MDDARDLLQSTFGYPNFRQSQEAAIKRLVVDNESALVIFPTGGGKSLCYQIPGMMLEGLTIVISPLLSLMKDQVDVLLRKGVKAASLDSTLSAEQSRAVKDGVRSGDLKLLYVAPERLNNENFIRLLEGVTVSLLAIDEAHCVSEWGPSFRPGKFISEASPLGSSDLESLHRIPQESGAERVLALTATATRSVEKDICEGFGIDETAGVFRTPTYRDNLHLSIMVAKDMKEKLDSLLPKLKARNGPVIIYVTLQKQAEEAMNQLKSRGITNCQMYHGGMKNDDRKSIQDWFMATEDGIVCATIAFAMGIDKNNIRQIHHLMLPKSLESWTQEIGRAGRDGLRSECSLYLCPSDVPVLEGFARGDACSKMVLVNWLTDVFNTVPEEDGTLTFNQYDQSKKLDIRPSMLNLLYAILELDYELLRARTPFYEVYTLKFKGNGLQKVTADDSQAAIAIKANWKGASSRVVNVIATALASGCSRLNLAGCVSGWESAGYVDSTASQVRSQYKLLKANAQLPTTAEKIDKLATSLAETMEQREKKEVRRLQDVLDVATGNRYYFGDGDSIPGGECKNCTYCKTKTKLVYSAAAVKDPPQGAIDAILHECGVRDDARFLTRIAFGITSPRISALGMQKSQLFGSCGNCDFDVLLKRFEEVCAKAGWKNRGGSSASVPAKRGAATSSRGSGSNKRGR